MPKSIRAVVSIPTIDLGDINFNFAFKVKGLKQYGIRWHLGPTADTTPDDRHPGDKSTRMKCAPTGKVDLIMDLMADKKVPLSVQWTDEVGNPVDAPADATAVYTVDDPSIINLTDNGDGSAEAASTGLLGTANVHLEATSGGKSFTGDLQIVVVAGLAERANIVAGEPEEVTPDA